MQIIAGLRKFTPATMEDVEAYIGRRDRSRINAVETVSFTSAGLTRQLSAIAKALERNDAWTADLAQSLSYLIFASRLDYFWHSQFRILFPDRAEPIALMDWSKTTSSMAFAFTLGWMPEATYLGYLVHALLNRGFQDESSYHAEHRRAHAFMARLFASWRNDGTGHRFPAWAQTVPVYEELLERWRESSEVVTPLLLAACDHHLEQGKLDTASDFFDFGDDLIARFPLEILMLLRLREREGISNPTLDHPLMEAPFDALPEPTPVPPPDDLMRGVLARAQADWPTLEHVLAIDAVRTAARRSDAQPRPV